jgi:thiamine pyrophosphate-dependent acetolactate synthase large subunit-like protein
VSIDDPDPVRLAPEFGSDVAVEVLRDLGIEYLAVLPGASFRGLHDSVVNFAGNTRPELIVLTHEALTVAFARGYARATGRPMAVALHNVVGLLNAAMSVYDAWADRSPVLILGGTGPLDAARRRPWIDWLHTANVQGNLVRDFTKFDDQPTSVPAMVQSILRAHRIAVTEPPGPTYVCLDVDLQERPLTEPIERADVARYAAGSPPAMSPADVADVARRLVAAETPVCFADRVNRSREGLRALLELTELLAMPVIDKGAWGHNFPTPHPLDFAGAEDELVAAADLVLAVDVVDLDGALTKSGVYWRGTRTEPGERQRVVSISLDEMRPGSLITDFQPLPAVDTAVLASPSVALGQLVDACRELLDETAVQRIDERRSRLAERHDDLVAAQRAAIERAWDGEEITEVRLLGELWQVVRELEFVIVAGMPRVTCPGLFAVPDPTRALGSLAAGAVGAATSAALGAALAYKGTDVLPVAIVGDGDLQMSIQALWTATHHQIPIVYVVRNNRTYNNDEQHQDRVAGQRGRPRENRSIGVRLDDPAIDFATIARSYGASGFGPVTDPAELPAALAAAVDVARRGGVAVVDVWTETRSAD